MERPVVIFGAGGVGFWLTVALCRSYNPKLITVYDDDTLQGGLGHTRLPSASLGTKKVSLLRGHLRVSWDHSNLPTFVDGRFTGIEAPENALIVDCCDMPIKERRKIWKRVERRKNRIIRVSYDGKNGVVVVAEGLPLFDSVAGGYSEVPNLALSFMAGGAGAWAVLRVLENWNSIEYIDFQITLDELISPKLVKGFNVVSAA